MAADSRQVNRRVRGLRLRPPQTVQPTWIVEADSGGKLKTFVQLNAIGWLIGARMLEQGHPGVFAGDDHAWVRGVRIIGIILYGLSAVLTVTSGIAYFRRHGRVLFN